MIYSQLIIFFGKRVGKYVIPVRNFRAAKERESALELLHSFQTLEFSKALYIVSNLPVGLSKVDIEKPSC